MQDQIINLLIKLQMPIDLLILKLSKASATAKYTPPTSTTPSCARSLVPAAVRYQMQTLWFFHQRSRVMAGPKFQSTKPSSTKKKFVKKKSSLKRNGARSKASYISKSKKGRSTRSSWNNARRIWIESFCRMPRKRSSRSSASETSSNRKSRLPRMSVTDNWSKLRNERNLSLPTRGSRKLTRLEGCRTPYPKKRKTWSSSESRRERLLRSFSRRTRKTSSIGSKRRRLTNNTRSSYKKTILRSSIEKTKWELMSGTSENKE